MMQHTETDETQAIHPDVLFGILANETRRSILRILDGDQLVLSRGQLMDLVAEDVHGREYTTKDRDRIRIEWAHDHKDLLKDNGVIQVGRDSISLGPNADQVIGHLELLGE